MAGHVDRIRQGYDELARGDIQRAAQDWAEDFVWQCLHSAELPMGGEHVGRAPALRVLQRVAGPWDEFRFCAEEFFEDGETVVVLGHSDVMKGRQFGHNARRADVGAPARGARVTRWRVGRVGRSSGSSS